MAAHFEAPLPGAAVFTRQIARAAVIYSSRRQVEATREARKKEEAMSWR